MTNSIPTATPGVLRRLNTASSSALVELAAIFEDLQTVLRCCERLVSELAAGDGEPDDVVVEAVWTVALLSYARCFQPPGAGMALTEDDLTGTQSHADVLDWHRVLLQLRDHYADPRTNPRERFSVGVAQNSDGAANGVAVTSTRQPLVDVLTVRQTGAIAFALSALVDDRITAQQEKVFGEVKNASKADLHKLPRLDVARSDWWPVGIRNG
jgi:hypothetical protein